MNKYDCTRTADYYHEYNRMCKYYTKTSGCYVSCPLRDMDCTIDGFHDELIVIVQKWSDEHPEKMPRITKAEQDFLEAFMEENLIISRQGNYLILSGWGYGSVKLYNTMFPFITDERYWTIGELLKLEVEE